MTVNLAIRNVSLVDGTGAAIPDEPVDVVVDGERIAAVGSGAADGLAAEVTIDGAGRCLAPGFVDVHTHDDGALLRHPGMEFKLAQGCTSVVIGNCGFSAIPAKLGVRDPTELLGTDPTWTDLEGFARAVDQAKPAVNAMALVGHNTIRHLVMGNDRRPPTDAELVEMRDHVARAMDQGACGFSTGLIYQPGRYSQTEELIELAKPAAAAGGIYTSHLRNEGDHLLDAVDEAIRIGRAAGLPVQISHHKSAGRRNWGKVSESLAKVDEANRAGADVTLDVYPYTAGSGPMAHYFDLDKLDPELAEVIRFASCPPFRHYEGRMVVDLAAEQGVEPVDVIRQVLTAPGGELTICIQFIIDEDDIETNLRHPLMMVGSDGVVDLKGRPHPRLFGTFPRILAHYVRDRGVLTLENAVHRMTEMSCRRFGIVDRGVVAEGMFADLVLFDADRVTDIATYDDPKREPAGIDAVIVNGAIAYRDGTHTAVGSGRMLTYRAAT
jgi:N-acyl-D-aspartate/D-glutamate deacylase